jgi:hypothetical protein
MVHILPVALHSTTHQMSQDHAAVPGVSIENLSAMKRWGVSADLQVIGVAALQPRSTRFELLGPLKCVEPLVPTYAFPSLLSAPDHLAALARPVVVRAAVHPPPRPRDQATISLWQH